MLKADPERGISNFSFQEIIRPFSLALDARSQSHTWIPVHCSMDSEDRFTISLHNWSFKMHVNKLSGFC